MTNLEWHAKQLEQQVRDLTEKNKELQAKVDDIPNLITWIDENSWGVLTDSGNWYSMAMDIEVEEAEDVYKKYLSDTQ